MQSRIYRQFFLCQLPFQAVFSPELEFSFQVVEFHSKWFRDVVSGCGCTVGVVALWVWSGTIERACALCSKLMH